MSLEITLDNIVVPTRLKNFYRELRNGIEEINKQQEKKGILAQPEAQQEILDYFVGELHKNKKNYVGEIMTNRLAYKDVLNTMTLVDDKRIENYFEKKGVFDPEQEDAVVREAIIRWELNGKEYKRTVPVDQYVRDENFEEFKRKKAKYLPDKSIIDNATVTLMRNVATYNSIDDKVLVTHAHRDKDFSVRKAVKDILWFIGARTQPGNDTSGNQQIYSEVKDMYAIMNMKRAEIAPDKQDLESKGGTLIIKDGKVLDKVKPLLEKYDENYVEDFLKQAKALNDFYMLPENRNVDIPLRDKKRMMFQFNLDYIHAYLGVETQFLDEQTNHILREGALAHGTRYAKARTEEVNKEFRERGVDLVAPQMVSALHNFYAVRRAA